MYNLVTDRHKMNEVAQSLQAKSELCDSPCPTIRRNANDLYNHLFKWQQEAGKKDFLRYIGLAMHPRPGTKGRPEKKQVEAACFWCGRVAGPFWSLAETVDSDDFRSIFDPYYIYDRNDAYWDPERLRPTVERPKVPLPHVSNYRCYWQNQNLRPTMGFTDAPGAVILRPSPRALPPPQPMAAPPPPPPAVAAPQPMEEAAAPAPPPPPPAVEVPPVEEEPPPAVEEEPPPAVEVPPPPPRWVTAVAVEVVVVGNSSASSSSQRNSGSGSGATSRSSSKRRRRWGQQ